MKNYKGDPFEVIETYRLNNRTFGVVRFINTETIADFRLDQIKSLNIKDRYEKDVCGVACIGNVKKVNHTQEYGIWNKMIERCYYKHCPAYKNYGAKNVTVSEDWLCFESFLRDIKEIDGYDEVLFKAKKLELDKDFKQMGSRNKVYSKTTCTFLSSSENSSLVERKDVTKVRAYGRKEGCNDEIYIDNIQKFAKENGLRHSKIYECLSGKRHRHMGWTFRRSTND